VICWEYRHEPASASLAELNALGGDGWEVAGQTDVVHQKGAGRRVEERVWLLRRPAQAAGMVTGD
jgi:hypothetical protein